MGNRRWAQRLPSLVRSHSPRVCALRLPRRGIVGRAPASSLHHIVKLINSMFKFPIQVQLQWFRIHLQKPLAFYCCYSDNFQVFKRTCSPLLVALRPRVAAPAPGPAQACFYCAEPSLGRSRGFHREPRRVLGSVFYAARALARSSPPDVAPTRGACGGIGRIPPRAPVRADLSCLIQVKLSIPELLCHYPRARVNRGPRTARFHMDTSSQ